MLKGHDQFLTTSESSLFLTEASADGAELLPSKNLSESSPPVFSLSLPPELPEAVQEQLWELHQAAQSPEAVWRFLMQFLAAYAKHIPFMGLSLFNEQQQSITLQYYLPQTLPKRRNQNNALEKLLNLIGPNGSETQTLEDYAPAPCHIPPISLQDTQNHLVQAYLRKDTTFCMNLLSLAPQAMPDFLTHIALPDRDATELNLFTVPLLTQASALEALTPIGLVTIGVRAIDLDTQSILSALYGIQKPLAEVLQRVLERQKARHPQQYRPTKSAEKLTEKPTIPEQAIPIPLTVDSLPDTSKTALTDTETILTLLERALQSTQATRQPLSFLLMGFQATATGCDTLPMASVLHRLRKNLRLNDESLLRLGGNIIAVVLPGLDALNASKLAARLAKPAWLPKTDTGVALTCGLGVVSVLPEVTEATALLASAQKALKLAQFKAQKTARPAVVLSRKYEETQQKILVDVFCEQITRQALTTCEQPEFAERHWLCDSLMHRLVFGQQLDSDTQSLRPYLMVETLASMLEAVAVKYPFERVATLIATNHMAVALGTAMQLPAELLPVIRLAGLLLPLGKMSIPNKLLFKRTSLNATEWELLRLTPAMTLKTVVSQLGDPDLLQGDLLPVLEGVSEHFCGTGYPRSLHGSDIPLASRVLSVAVAFQALTHSRPYRPAKSITEALAVLQENSLGQWDPTVVQAFCGMLEIALKVRK